MRPRVFISSVMQGFEDYRQAAKQGIIAACAEPVMVEDYPSLSVSARTACLDGVASCDIYLVIVGQRGGWTAPSGKLVVEEEYQEARRRRLRVLAFLQNVELDPEAERFAATLSDYVEGHFRKIFNTLAELQTDVVKALKPLIEHYDNVEVDPTVIQEKLKTPYEIYGQSVLRFVLASERQEEIIDSVSLEEADLRQLLYDIGHSPLVQLFSYERPKTTNVGVNEIVILQSDEGRRRDGVDEVRMELTIKGMIVIDANVTGRRVKNFDATSGSYFCILEDDVAAVHRRCFAFANGFYAAKDCYNRYDRFLYNVVLSGVEHRKLVSQLPKGTSYSMGLQSVDFVQAFDGPRLITRAELAKPEEQIKAVISLLGRRLQSQ